MLKKDVAQAKKTVASLKKQVAKLKKQAAQISEGSGLVRLLARVEQLVGLPVVVVLDPLVVELEVDRQHDEEVVGLHVRLVVVRLLVRLVLELDHEPHDHGRLGRMSQDVRPAPTDLRHAFRSMASQWRVWVVRPTAAAGEDVAEAQALVERVAATCTRFDPRAISCARTPRAAGGTRCARVLRGAAGRGRGAPRDGRAVRPRVLMALTAIGYDRSLPFESRRLALSDEAGPSRRRPWRRKPWRPDFDDVRSAVRIGREPVDLGGIGKGLAVHWAAELLAGSGESVLVEAGGDIMCLGDGPEGEGWLVDVENPFGGDPAAVLRVLDVGVATSSTRIRSWKLGERQVHHLIDPRTGLPAESDLASVTVVSADSAIAEV
ncbi:MAG: FAD:protein FMN transferase [Candidatus Nanopelagicales bacterium]